MNSREKTQMAFMSQAIRAQRKLVSRLTDAILGSAESCLLDSGSGGAVATTAVATTAVAPQAIEQAAKLDKAMEALDLIGWMQETGAYACSVIVPGEPPRWDVHVPGIGMFYPYRLTPIEALAFGRKAAEGKDPDAIVFRAEDDARTKLEQRNAHLKQENARLTAELVQARSGARAGGKPSIILSESVGSTLRVSPFAHE